MKRVCRYVNGQAVWEPPFTPEEEAEHRARLTELLETRQLPFIMTDSVFLEGHCNGNQFDRQGHNADYLKKEAEAAGQNVKGKVYIGGLAAYPGDPEAWVSGRGDVQRVLEKRGWNSTGAVNYRAPEIDRPETPPVLVADDLVDEEVNQILSTVERPDLVDKQDLREQVIDKRKPPPHLQKPL